jgi:hypothetical protein
MAKLSDEMIEHNMARVQSLVKTFPESRRKLVAKMLSGPVGEEFFTAPASAREEYHNCFPGGLCDHSLRVVTNLHEVTAALLPKLAVEVGMLNFVGLFHDLGKVGDGTNPYYVPNPDDWQRTKRGMLYNINKDCVYMPTSERGLYILQKYGIELSSDEYLAIRLNDGQYDDTNKNYRMKEPDLALLVHFADRWATSQEKDTL